MPPVRQQLKNPLVEAGEPRSGSVESGGRILVTGATGYIGGRLLARLEEQSRLVRCLARHPEFLRGRVDPGTEVVRADLTRPETLPAAV